MYIGFAVTALDLVLSAVTLNRYNYAFNAAKGAANGFTALGETHRAAAQTAIMNTQNTMSGVMLTAFVIGLLVLACWVWLAMATRRGKGWTQIAGTVLIGIYSIAALVVVFGTQRDPGPQSTTIVGSRALGSRGHSAVVQQARDFFYTWRTR